MLARTRNPERRARLEARLACPDLPNAGLYLWRIFHRLRRRKGSNGFALSPIEWPDIDAFVRHSRMPLTPWEVGIVEELDDLFLANMKPASQADGNKEHADP